MESLIARLELLGCTVVLDHIPRAQNSEADGLANRAMDDQESVEEHAPALEEILSRMQQTLSEPVMEANQQHADPNIWSPHMDAKTPRLAAMPSTEELETLAAELHLASRGLQQLTNTKLWPKHICLAWSQACRKFTPVLKEALDSDDPLQLTQALLDLLELPTTTLRRYLPKPGQSNRHRSFNHPDPIGAEAQGDPNMRRAVNLTYQDLTGKAMQALLSNGIAESNVKILEILKSMHPKRREALHTHPTTTPQVTVSVKAAKRALYNAAGADNSSMGCFGWSASLLLPIRGPRKGGRYIPFISQLARLVARIGSVNVPTSFHTILPCGGLFALHKLDVQAQVEREMAGLDPSVRPVNVGCCFLKWALQLALHSVPAREAIQLLQPLQSGLAKRGIESTAHLMRALWELGYGILPIDFVNGFNALSRQKMLDAVNKRAPSLNSAFNAYYAGEGMCFFVIGKEVHVIRSSEGSRMGCALGSFGFDITIQDLYELVERTFPTLVTRAATDDYTMAALPQNMKDLRKAFELVRDKAKSDLNLEIGYHKSFLLLPPAAVDDSKINAESLFPDIHITTTGLRIVGAPIGTDEYCTQVNASLSSPESTHRWACCYYVPVWFAP